MATRAPTEPDGPPSGGAVSATLPILSVADLIAAADQRTGPRLHPIDVPEWGCRLMVRRLTRTEDIWIQENCVNARTGRIDLARVDREGFVRMVVQPKFKAADYQALCDNEAAAPVLRRINQQLSELNDGVMRGASMNGTTGPGGIDDEPSLDGVGAAVGRLKS